MNKDTALKISEARLLVARLLHYYDEDLTEIRFCLDGMVFCSVWQHVVIPTITTKTRPDFYRFSTASVYFSLLTHTPTVRAVKEGRHLKKA